MLHTLCTPVTSDESTNMAPVHWQSLRFEQPLAVAPGCNLKPTVSNSSSAPLVPTILLRIAGLDKCRLRNLTTSSIHCDGLYARWWHRMLHGSRMQRPPDIVHSPSCVESRFVSSCWSASLLLANCAAGRLYSSWAADG